MKTPAIPNVGALSDHVIKNKKTPIKTNEIVLGRPITQVESEKKSVSSLLGEFKPPQVKPPS